jgi:hypothetical protein
VKKINNIIFTAVLAVIFAFGIGAASGSSAYAFQGGHFMKHSAMTKKTSKKAKKAAEASQKKL